MRISSQQLARALVSAFEQHPERGDEVIDRFVSWCRQYHVLPFLPRVLFHVERFARERKAGESVEVAIARRVSQKTVTDLLRKCGFDLKPNSDRVHISVDSTLIGGFRVRTQNRVWDGSVRNQLNRVAFLWR